jgi:hypothetical protein
VPIFNVGFISDGCGETLVWMASKVELFAQIRRARPGGGPVGACTRRAPYGEREQDILSLRAMVWMGSAEVLHITVFTFLGIGHGNGHLRFGRPRQFPHRMD